jgi:hypothetical protein
MELVVIICGWGGYGKAKILSPEYLRALSPGSEEHNTVQNKY